MITKELKQFSIFIAFKNMGFMRSPDNYVMWETCKLLVPIFEYYMEEEGALLNDSTIEKQCESFAHWYSNREDTKLELY